MKRLILAGVLCCTPVLFAQEHAPSGEAAKEAHENAAAHESGEHGDPYLIWKVVNFAILAGGLGYLMAKTLPEFYRNRTAEIRRSLDEAAVAKAEAETRAAEIERRMAALGSEIEKLQTESKEEMAHESARTKAETERILAKIQAQAEQEVASISKHARSDLKNYAAQLALEIAQQLIRSQMTPQAQTALVEGFVKDLDQHHTRRETH